MFTSDQIVGRSNALSAGRWPPPPPLVLSETQFLKVINLAFFWSPHAFVSEFIVAPGQGPTTGRCGRSVLVASYLTRDRSCGFQATGQNRTGSVEIFLSWPWIGNRVSSSEMGKNFYIDLLAYLTHQLPYEYFFVNWLALFFILPDSVGRVLRVEDWKIQYKSTDKTRWTGLIKVLSWELGSNLWYFTNKIPLSTLYYIYSYRPGLGINYGYEIF